MRPRWTTLLSILMIDNASFAERESQLIRLYRHESVH